MSTQASPRGSLWLPGPPERWPSAPKGAPGNAQDEFKVPKSIAKGARGIKKCPGRGGSTAVDPPPCISEVPKDPQGPPRTRFGTLRGVKSCFSCRILVVPADSLISTLLEYDAVSGEGGNTPTRVIPTDVLVSFPLSPCSSLRARGQHTHASQISKSSCQSPAFPLLNSSR